MVNEFALTLYPFIDGRIGGDFGLSEPHWITFGRTVKQIHMSELPPELMPIIPRETFVPSRRSVITNLEEAISGRVLADPVNRRLVTALRSKLGLLLFSLKRGTRAL
jgi:spectinomycin phosphotransferase